MKKPGVINYFFLTLLLFAGTVILYALMGIIPSEGFNPSDDGVILAQSYRLLQGQIPHLDFISIRPIGSAVFHSIHFISPLPLEISARWLTLLEYLSYSLLWSWIMVRFTRIRKYRGLVFFVLLGIWGFLLNQNFYNLFPWTTIDAVFWMMLALSFYLPDPSGLFHRRVWLKVAIITFFASMAALSRQTFALPVLILMACLIYHGIKRNKGLQLFLGIGIGAIPGFIYFSILLINAALPLFIQQLTGRTELIDTGISRFYTEFWSSPIAWIYILVIFLLLLYRFTEGNRVGNVFRLSLIPVGRIFFGVLFIVLGFCVFISPGSLFGQSFAQYWLLVLLWVFEEVTGQIKANQRRWFFWILLISWTSAISLGDNAPVFTLGLINATGIAYIIFQFAERGFSIRRLTHLQLVSVVLLLTLTILSLGVQRKVNYRDVKAGAQEFELNAIFPEMGRISTNASTYSFMAEVDSLYRVLGFPNGRFVLLPNSAIIYPIIGTPNPFPLDWMQGPEFVGSEKELMQGVRTALDEKEIFFLIDKYDSKRLADTLIPAKYPQNIYPYMKDLLELTKEYPINSKWFDVRVTK